MFLEIYDGITWQLVTVLQPSGADCDNNDCNRERMYRGVAIWVITNNRENGKFLADCGTSSGYIGGSITKHTKDEVVFNIPFGVIAGETKLKVENGQLKMIRPYVDESVPEGELIFTYNEIVYYIEDCVNWDLDGY